AGPWAAGCAAAGRDAAAPACDSSTRATTAPTGTVSPGAKSCSVRTPAIGEGTSSVALSVSTSTMGSSTATGSPTDLSQLPMMTSEIDSPAAGTLTSVAILDPS